MATFTGKILASGTLPDSIGTLYTVPAATVAFVKAIDVFQPNASTETIIISLKPGATSRKWKQAILDINEMAEFLTDGETVELPTGALIQGQSTNNAVVNYIISGVEQT